jgi:hypothetical protein
MITELQKLQLEAVHSDVSVTINSGRFLTHSLPADPRS